MSKRSPRQSFAQSLHNNPSQPAGFARYRTRASVLLRSPDELRALTVRAARKLAGAGGVSENFSAARGQLNSLLALLKAYASGEYRAVSTRAIISIVAALLYFVVPMDLVPDFLLVLGLVDDAAVIGYVFTILRAEVADFEDWRVAQPTTSGGDSR